MKRIKTFLAVTGILLIALGIVCFIYPVATLASVAWLIGLLTLCAGITEMAFSLNTQHFMPNSGSVMLRAILLVILGIFFLCNTPAVMASLPFVFAMWIVIDSIGLCIQSFDLKKEGFNKWWCSLVFGIVGVIIGIYALTDPVGSGISLSILIGLGLIATGIARLTALLGIHRFKKVVTQAMSEQ